MNNEGKKGLNRREFLKAAMVSGAGVALTACGPDVAATTEATEEAAAAAEAPAAAAAAEQPAAAAVAAAAGPSYLIPPEPIAADQIAEAKDFDVVVVGAGMSGSAAALAATQAGAKVAILQKGPMVLTNGAGIAACNSQIQQEAGIEFDAEEAINEWMREGGNRADRKVVQLWIDHSGPTIDWMVENTKDSDAGVPIAPPNAGETYPDDYTKAYPTAHLWLNEVIYLATALVDKAVEEGAEVYFDTPGVQLVQADDGAITGVIAQNVAGEYLQFNAAKGVVLAAGDYGQDSEMRKDFFPHAEGLVHVYPTKGNTGDGVKMGLWAGADITKAPHSGIIHYDPSPLPEGDVVGSGLPWLAINLNGERFSNEDTSYGLLYAQDMWQPEYTHYQIFDGKYLEDYEHMGKGMMRTEPPLDMDGGMVDAVERGAALKADSLEELAEMMGVPTDAFLATVERYNELAELGEDLDYGKKAERLSTIVEAPFYGVKRVPGVLGILGGLTVNDKLEVLDKNRNVIPGLYACGNTSGSYFTGFEHPMRIPGMSLGRASTTGRLAGLSAAGEEF